MTTTALHLVRMDVAHDHEAVFNEVYDKEHLPNLRGTRAVYLQEPRPLREQPGLRPEHFQQAVNEAKARGWVRIEGKDYVMHDGDVVEFRFNV